MNLREYFAYIDENKMNANAVYTYVTDPLLHPKHPLLRDELTGVIDLFNWSPIECDELKNLQSAITRNTLPEKSTNMYAICLSVHMH